MESMKAQLIRNFDWPTSTEGTVSNVLRKYLAVI